MKIPVYFTKILLGSILVFAAAMTQPAAQRLRKSDIVRRAYQLVSAQVESESSRKLWARLRSPSLIQNYIRDHSIRKLQLGAGGHRLDAWLNTDIVMADGLAHLDATKRFPLEDASFHYVYSEHLIGPFLFFPTLFLAEV